MAGQKGRSGRRRKPREIKEQNGTIRADRDPPGVKMPTVFVGEKPPGLHPTASDEWDRLVIIAQRAGILTDADWPAWQLGFWSYSVVLHLMDSLGGRSVDEWSQTFESGARQSIPEFTMMKSAWSQTLQFCREFGLTASSRSGMDIDNGQADPNDPTEEFLN